MKSISQDVSPSDYKGKWLQCSLSKRRFTFVCPIELLFHVSEHCSEFNKIGAELLAVSTDSEYSHKNWIEVMQVPVE